MSFYDLLGDLPDDNDGAPYGRKFSLENNSVHAVTRGVSIPWLCQAFQMPRSRVEKKLIGAPVAGTSQRGSKIYDLSVAASYLIEPRYDVAAYISTLEPKDLPENLRSEFWSARLKEQKARLVAKDLWHSSDVKRAFGEVFKLIKDKVTLWTDELDESRGLTPEHIAVLDDYARDLLASIGDAISGYTHSTKTTSQEAEFPEEDDFDVS